VLLAYLPKLVLSHWHGDNVHSGPLSASQVICERVLDEMHEMCYAHASKAAAFSACAINLQQAIGCGAVLRTCFTLHARGLHERSSWSDQLY
jgi:hypothetical protein